MDSDKLHPPIGLGSRWVSVSLVKSLTPSSPEQHHGVLYSMVKGAISGIPETSRQSRLKMRRSHLADWSNPWASCYDE
jgi:hypothetical protein